MKMECVYSAGSCEEGMTPDVFGGGDVPDPGGPSIHENTFSCSSE